MSNDMMVALPDLLSSIGVQKSGRSGYSRDLHIEVGTKEVPYALRIGSVNSYSGVDFLSTNSLPKETLYKEEMQTIRSKLKWMTQWKNAKHTGAFITAVQMETIGLRNYIDQLTLPAWLRRYKLPGQAKFLGGFYLTGSPIVHTNFALERGLPLYSPVYLALVDERISMDEAEKYLTLPMGLQSSLLSETID